MVDELKKIKLAFRGLSDEDGGAEDGSGDELEDDDDLDGSGLPLGEEEEESGVTE